MSRRGKSATSVFVRNVHHEARSEDIRKMFSKYGDISDVYLPLDYYTREPRGFAYIQFDYRDDADDAIYYLDGVSLFGRALEVQLAQGDRKTPGQMRYRSGPGSRRSGSRSRSRSRSPRRRRRRSGSRTPSRSRSPPRRRSSRVSRSPPPRSKSPRRKSRSKSRSASPPLRRSRSRSKSKTP